MYLLVLRTAIILFQEKILPSFASSQNNQSMNHDSVTLYCHAVQGSPICLVQTLRGYLQRDLPNCFPSLVNADGSPLTAYQFQFLLKKSVWRPWGTNTLGYSSHSFYTGAAKGAGLNGISISDIQSLGQWKSPAVNL